MIQRTITASESGKKLHRFLRTLMPNIPLGQIYKMIDQGKVRVNGKRKNQNYELGAGDELAIHMEDERYETAIIGQKKTKYVGVNANIDIVFEDDELLVANKPAGMLTHPDRTDQKDTLINRVHAYLYRKGALDSALFMPATANRLDRNTSGLVLIGKTAGMLHRLNDAIQKRQLDKYYVTLAQGRMTGEGEVSGALVREERGNRTLVAEEGGSDGGGAAKEATTRYRALASGGGYTLVEIELISGRTHQIRAHFQSIGHSLLGDVKYGGKPFAGVNHQLLHAWRIALPDGRTFRAPLPSLFRETMEKLGIPLP